MRFRSQLSTAMLQLTGREDKISSSLVSQKLQLEKLWPGNNKNEQRWQNTSSGVHSSHKSGMNGTKPGNPTGHTAVMMWPADTGKHVAHRWSRVRVFMAASIVQSGDSGMFMRPNVGVSVITSSYDLIVWSWGERKGAETNALLLHHNRWKHVPEHRRVPEVWTSFTTQAVWRWESATCCSSQDELVIWDKVKCFNLRNNPQSLHGAMLAGAETPG